MSREFPDRVNPWTAAEGRRIFAGTLPLDRMKRLAPLLASDEGDCRFEARFERDPEGYAIIDIAVEAEVSLVCQRSLAPFVQPLARRSLLAVIEDEAEQEVLPAHYEPVLATEGTVTFVDLVEDELLLAMPVVPRNPALAWDDVVASDEAEASEETEGGPFAGLADLMSRRER